MVTWKRWQDWAIAAVGLVLAVTPLWFDPGTTGAVWGMVVLGAALVVVSGWSLIMPAAEAVEWTHAAVGVLAFVAPWAFGYADQAGAAWTSWIAGAAAVVLGLWAVPRIEHMFHRTATPH
jgi:SPW repeat